MNLLKIYLVLLFVNINIRGADNMTQLDKSKLTGSVLIKYEGSKYHYGVTASDIRGWYQQCYDGEPDECTYIVIVPANSEFRLCEYKLHHLYKKPQTCSTVTGSRVCLLTQPGTNRLLHQTIPPAVYITGIIFNIIIILVLQFKAENSVMNVLLLMLAVWDLLYLGCLLVESCIGHYTYIITQIQISDLSYPWLTMRCQLENSRNLYACNVGNKWQRADNNVYMRNIHYPLMYWLHVAAMVFQMASVYHTTVIATFRCIAIWRPFQAPQLLTYTTAAVATCSSLLLVVVVHVPAFIAGETIAGVINCYNKLLARDYDYEYEYKECLTNSTAHNPLYTASTSTFMNLHQYYHVIIYSIILFLALPFLLLLVLNIVMLAELYRGTGCGASYDNENKAVTKVVAAIVTVFLITYIVKPLYIVDIYYADGRIMNSIAFQSCGGYFTVSLIITILPALNSVINLLLYLGLRQTFRQQFSSLFSFCKRDVNLQRPEAIALQPIHR